MFIRQIRKRYKYITNNLLLVVDCSIHNHGNIGQIGQVLLLLLFISHMSRQYFPWAVSL